MSENSTEQINSIFKRKAAYYEEALGSFEVFRAGAQRTGLESLLWISDISIFSLMASYDLWITVCDYQKTDSSYAQNYYARLIALSLHELNGDITQYGARMYQKLLVEAIDDTEIVQSAQSIMKRLNQARSKDKGLLSKVRDITIAHRDHDIEKVVKTMSGIDYEELMTWAISYLNLLDELHLVLDQAIKKIDSDLKAMQRPDFIAKYTID